MAKVVRAGGTAARAGRPNSNPTVAAIAHKKIVYEVGARCAQPWYCPLQRPLSPFTPTPWIPMASVSLPDERPIVHGPAASPARISTGILRKILLVIVRCQEEPTTNVT